MSDRNVVQTTFDDFGKASGGRKKSGSCYRRSEETIFVLNLQKSNYSVRYYINVAVWLLALGEIDAPKENKCQVRTQLDELVGPSHEGRLTELLGMGSPIEDAIRRSGLLALLEEHVRPVVDAAMTLDGLRSKAGQALITLAQAANPTCSRPLRCWSSAVMDSATADLAQQPISPVKM